MCVCVCVCEREREREREKERERERFECVAEGLKQESFNRLTGPLGNKRRHDLP